MDVGKRIQIVFCINEEQSSIPTNLIGSDSRCLEEPARNRYSRNCIRFCVNFNNILQIRILNNNTT